MWNRFCHGGAASDLPPSLARDNETFSGFWFSNATFSGLLHIPGLKLYGIKDRKRFDCRCPTVAVRIAGHTPLQLATELGQRGFFTLDGNYYARNLTEHLGLEKDGGFLRIGLAHYNTAEEVERFLVALGKFQ